RLAVGERVTVVLGHPRQRDVCDLASLERQAELVVLRTGDSVRGVRVDANGDDRAAQLVRPARERDLLRRPAQRRLTELRKGLLVEREDEVRLRLDLAAEVLGER